MDALAPDFGIHVQLQSRPLNVGRAGAPFPIRLIKLYVLFRRLLEGGHAAGKGDSQLRHIDRAWASTVHAFQGRTVDTVIAAMEAEHPHLTTQKSFYVEISRARHRAELVTDDRRALGEHLKQANG